MKKGLYINDSIHGLIQLSEYEGRIISSIAFNRLHDVYQNSTVYMTFPSNRTKRFEHSIGTMKLCSDMFFRSVLNASDENITKFYTLADQKVGDIYQHIKETPDLKGRIPGRKLSTDLKLELEKLECDAFRNSLIPYNVPQNYKSTHLILIQSIRAAALLHDIGHPPFSHIVEYAMRDTYDDITQKNASVRTERMQKYTNILEPYFGSPDAGTVMDELSDADNQDPHERIGQSISRTVLCEIILKARDYSDIRAERIFETIVMVCVDNIFHNKEFFADLHKIIDSSLDGDRLDYVTRDSANSGMNSGKIDYNRIINDMKLIMDDNGRNVHFCVPLKAESSVEDFIKRRYNIYKDIIFHHHVIKTDRLMNESVKYLIKDYLADTSKVHESETDAMPLEDISGLWLPLLKNQTDDEYTTALSQWNDSWLMTVLKHLYYSKYYYVEPDDENKGDVRIKRILDELLRNQKCYYSIIKRSEDFKIVDNALQSKLKANKERIMERYSALKSNNADANGDSKLNIDATLDFIKRTIDPEEKSKGFILNKIWKRDWALLNMEDYDTAIKTIVEEQASKLFPQIGETDIIVENKHLSVGLDDPIYFYDGENHTRTLDDISGIKEILTLDKSYQPGFYIYVYSNTKTISPEMKESFLKAIGEEIGVKISEKLMDTLNDMSKRLEK